MLKKSTPQFQTTTKTRKPVKFSSHILVSNYNPIKSIEKSTLKPNIRTQPIELTAKLIIVALGGVHNIPYPVKSALPKVLLRQIRKL